MNRVVVFSVTAVVVASLHVAGPAPARAQQETVCAFTFEAAVSPGLTASAGKGTWTTNGDTGTVDCNGPVNGKQPTGTGRLAVDAIYGESSAEGDTCAGGAGRGRYSFSLPTATGPVTVADDFTYRYGRIPPPGQPGLAEFRSRKWSGTVEIVPTKGNCFETPMTAFKASGRGPFKES